jgi:hypothetical protein
VSVLNCRAKKMLLSFVTWFLCRIVGLRKCNCSVSIIRKDLVELSNLDIRTPKAMSTKYIFCRFKTNVAPIGLLPYYIKIWIRDYEKFWPGILGCACMCQALSALINYPLPIPQHRECQRILTCFRPCTRAALI